MERIRITNDQTLIYTPPSNVVFYQNFDNRSEILRLESNGDIFVKGKLIENDKEVVDALRKFLIGQQLLK